MNILLSLLTAWQESLPTHETLLNNYDRRCSLSSCLGKGKQTSGAAFTRSKIYVFSRRQLTSLYSRVASIIVSILTLITCSDELAVLLPRAPGQRRDLWKVPALFGDTHVKRISCPSGFNSFPNLSRVKDVIS